MGRKDGTEKLSASVMQSNSWRLRCAFITEWKDYALPVCGFDKTTKKRNYDSVKSHNRAKVLKWGLSLGFEKVNLTYLYLIP